MDVLIMVLLSSEWLWASFIHSEYGLSDTYALMRRLARSSLNVMVDSPSVRSTLSIHE